MKFLFPIIAIALVVYISGIFLEASPVARVIDEKIGMSVPQPDTSAWRFTEGGSITRFKKHGLNAALPDGIANVYLHGDSYIEALMVPDDKKPDAVLTHALGGTNLVWGIGRSGTGLPSFIVHAREYERAFGIPKVHIFFVTSLDDVTCDQGDEFVWGEHGVRKCAPRMSEAQMRLSRIINRYHLNFILSAYTKINQLKHKRWRFLPYSVNGENPCAERELSTPVSSVEDKLDFLCDEMVRTIQAPVLIVYCPSTPVLINGEIIYQEGDACFHELKSKGVDFLDASPALNGLYEKTGILPRGFANGDGPGRGHLNVDGIESVFQYVANYLKGAYAL